MAGIFFPFKAKEVYAASPGAKYMVNPFLGMLMGLAGSVRLVLGRLGAGRACLPDLPFLIWAVRAAVIVGGVWFLCAAARIASPAG